MIKMYINNEEVVCDKNIEIKEEFLTTSSTILKNCYPKSWENNHEYVNNFYFPKDYSKCLIYDKENVSYSIYGNSTQDGTPTPSNPVEIINITGNTIVNINNKDYNVNLGTLELCKIGNYQDYIYKNNGIWYIHKEIGKKTLNGSENWTYNSGSRWKFRLVVSDILKFTNGNSVTPTTIISNRFSPSYWDNTNNNGTFTGMKDINTTISFANTDISSLADWKTWLSTNNTMVYYVLNTSTDTEITDNELLDELNNVGNNLIFCGVVKNTGNISLNPREPHYCDLQVLDFKTFLSEGETLDFVISDKTISEAINMVVNAVSQYGFIVGNIETTTADDVIGAYSTLNKTAYDVLQYLADITQCRWFTRMVDENTVAIDFYDSDLMVQKDDIEYTREFFEENNIQDIKFNYSTNDYRNKQIMLSEEIYGSIDYNETILADGFSKNFVTGANIGVLKSISVNGVSKTIATTDDRDLGIIADFYYMVSGNTIESDDLYTAGSEIVLVYTPLVKGRQIVVNDDEINRIGNQTGRNGIISRYETRNDSLSNEELNNIGQSYIKYKGKPEIKLKILTYNNDLYDIGNLVYFNAPLDDLKLTYMVKSKTTQIIATTGDIFYTYELSSSYNSESDINYFDNQRAKASGNIQSGEYITRNIDIENSANIIFNNLSIEPVSAGNILNAGLNMPLDN